MTEGTDMNQIEKVARPDAAIENLTHHQQQSDMDGTFVKVSRQALDEVLSFIAAMQPAPQWQGIKSAPRNGEAVLLWVPADDGWDAYVASGWYESGAFDRRWYAAVDENPLSPQPTHWMPLPTPPAGGSDAE